MALCRRFNQITEFGKLPTRLLTSFSADSSGHDVRCRQVPIGFPCYFFAN